MKNEEELWDASTRGDVEKVKELTSLPNININWSDPTDSRSVFYRACSHGRVEVVAFLLQLEKIDVNEPNKNNATPLYIACQEGYIEVLELLLKDPRVNVNMATKEGRTPFYKACEKGRLGVIELFLRDKRISITNQNMFGVTPLYVALKRRHFNIVELLLMDERIEFTSSQGLQSIYIAIENVDLLAIKWILASHKEISFVEVNRGQNLMDFLFFTYHSVLQNCRLERKQRYQEIQDLLEKYQQDPYLTKKRLRKELECQSNFFHFFIFLNSF
mgnify:CR=1 FL=1